MTEKDDGRKTKNKEIGSSGKQGAGYQANRLSGKGASKATPDFRSDTDKIWAVENLKRGEYYGEDRNKGAELD